MVDAGRDQRSAVGKPATQHALPGEQLEYGKNAAEIAADRMALITAEEMENHPGAAAAAASPTATLVLECPEGAGPGDTLEVEWEGNEIEIEIPAGVSAGQEFEVEIAPDDAVQEETTAAPADPLPRQTKRSLQLEMDISAKLGVADSAGSPASDGLVAERAQEDDEDPPAAGKEVEADGAEHARREQARLEGEGAAAAESAAAAGRDKLRTVIGIAAVASPAGAAPKFLTVVSSAVSWKERKQSEERVARTVLDDAMVFNADWVSKGKPSRRLPKIEEKGDYFERGQVLLQEDVHLKIAHKQWEAAARIAQADDEKTAREMRKVDSAHTHGESFAGEKQQNQTLAQVIAALTESNPGAEVTFEQLVGAGVATDVAHKAFETMDADGEGSISLAEFIAYENSRRTTVKLVLECPEGAGPGDTLEVEFEGRDVEIEIPVGVSAGQEFEVEIESEEPAEPMAVVSPRARPEAPFADVVPVDGSAMIAQQAATLQALSDKRFEIRFSAEPGAIQAAFTMFDLDSSGRIDVDELRSTAEQLGLQLTQVWENDFFEPFLC
jgi:hypothetical protein